MYHRTRKCQCAISCLPYTDGKNYAVIKAAITQEKQTAYCRKSQDNAKTTSLTFENTSALAVGSSLWILIKQRTMASTFVEWLPCKSHQSMNVGYNSEKAHVNYSLYPCNISNVLRGVHIVLVRCYSHTAYLDNLSNLLSLTITENAYIAINA